MSIPKHKTLNSHHELLLLPRGDLRVISADYQKAKIISIQSSSKVAELSTNLKYKNTSVPEIFIDYKLNPNIIQNLARGT